MFVGGAPVVARLNIRNKALSPVFEFRDSERYWSYVFDHRGQLRLRSRLAGDTLVWEHRRDDRQEFKEVVRHPFHGYMETWQPRGFAADNTTLWLISHAEHDRGALYAVDTNTFALGAPLFVPPQGEIADLIVTPDRSRLLGVRYEFEREHHHWFDAERAALQKRLEGTFTGCDIRETSVSDDGSVSLIWVGHDREPGTYYVLDRKAGGLTQFKRVRPLEPAPARELRRP
jgi:hypothetical protein